MGCRALKPLRGGGRAKTVRERIDDLTESEKEKEGADCFFFVLFFRRGAELDRSPFPSMEAILTAKTSTRGHCD